MTSSRSAENYDKESFDPEDIFEGLRITSGRDTGIADRDTYRETSVDPNSNEGGIYGQEPQFVHREEGGEDIEKVRNYLEDQDFDKFADLYEETLESALEGAERDLDGSELEDYKYLAVDEEEDIAIEYDIEEEEGKGYNITVKIHDMPEGLFGFTNLDGSVHVSDNLYKFEKESTIAHEITHHLNPADDEYTVRHKNGDVDPEHLPSTRKTRHRGGVPNAPNVQQGLKKNYPLSTVNTPYGEKRKVA